MGVNLLHVCLCAFGVCACACVCLRVCVCVCVCTHLSVTRVGLSSAHARDPSLDLGHSHRRDCPVMGPWDWAKQKPCAIMRRSRG